MHPRNLVYVTEMEEGVYDGNTYKTCIMVERELPETAIIHIAITMMTNDT